VQLKNGYLEMEKSADHLHCT